LDTTVPKFASFVVAWELTPDSEAIALYKRSGYVEVKAFNAEPYAHHWFEKTLGKKTQSGKVQ
jgi:hypothetical protein